MALRRVRVPRSQGRRGLVLVLLLLLRRRRGVASRLGCRMLLLLQAAHVGQQPTSCELGERRRDVLRERRLRGWGVCLRLHVAAANSYFYPDVLVTCSALDQASAMVKTEPKLIVEVLSPTTAAYDRGLKFSHYRSLPSLQEYVLIDLDTRAVDSYTLGADGLWVLHPFAANETVLLASVALPVTAAQLFAEV